MHADLKVTDGIYGVLSGADVGERIGGLGNGEPRVSLTNNAEIIAQLEALLAQMKANY